MNDQVTEANGMIAEDLPEFLKRNTPAAQKEREELEKKQKEEQGHKNVL